MQQPDLVEVQGQGDIASTGFKNKDPKNKNLKNKHT